MQVKSVGTGANLERDLERQVAASEGDFNSARNKLKLLRVCKAICKPADAQFEAVFVVGESLVDAILFQVLGDGDRRENGYNL